MDKWGYSLIELKKLWGKKKLLVTSNFSFFHNVFKSCLLLMSKNEYLWSKGLRSNSGICNLSCKYIHGKTHCKCACLIMMQLDKCPFAFPREIPYKRHRFRHIFQVKNLHVIFYQSSQLLHLIMLMITSF